MVAGWMSANGGSNLEPREEIRLWRRYEMLFRWKIEAMAGRLNVRESVFKLLIAVVTTSSIFSI
jgi:hypothetical protein